MAIGKKSLAPWVKVGLTQLGDGRSAVAENPSRRSCGDCTLCCKVMPVGELKKPAGRWCDHAMNGKGCAIYETRPDSCRLWSCLWAATPEWPDELRPRETHVIFDMMTETIRLNDSRSGAQMEMSAIQLWVDPVYPASHRTPLVRAMIAEIADRFRMPTLVRFGSKHGILVAAPSLSEDHQWHELAAPAALPEEVA